MTEVVDKCCALIANYNESSIASLWTHLYQKISYASWSTFASAILGQVPQHSRAPVPIQVHLEVI